MGRYLPFAGRNSIAEMSIGIQFALPFDQQQIGASAEAIRVEFANEFPKFEPVQSFTINLGMQPFPVAGGNPASTLSGFNLVKAKTDGTPGRVLRAIANVVSVHFLEYTSWKETKPQAIDYITRCLEKMATIGHNSATSVLLRYVDRFTFDGAPQDATAGQLFRPDSKFVASKLLNCGNQWHSNSGWFEPFVGASNVLNQLNMLSTITATAVDVNVEHNCIYALPKASTSIVDLTHGDGERPSLEAILDRQHTVNADLLKNLLNPEMLSTIGLGG